MVRRDAPPAAILVPNVCRRSWKRIERTPAASIASLKRFLVPVGHASCAGSLMLAAAGPSRPDVISDPARSPNQQDCCPRRHADNDKH